MILSTYSANVDTVLQSAAQVLFWSIFLGLSRISFGRKML